MAGNMSRSPVCRALSRQVQCCCYITRREVTATASILCSCVQPNLTTKGAICPWNDKNLFKWNPFETIRKQDEQMNVHDSLSPLIHL